MIDIIKVELFRLKKSVLFWVMLGLAAATPLISVALNVILLALTGLEYGQTINVLEQLSAAGMTAALLQQMSSNYSYLALWTIISTSVILSKEFVDGTMRNVVLANKSRAELFFGYVITSLIVAVSYLTAFLATTLIIAAPIFGFQGASAGKVVSAIFCSYGLGIIALTFIVTCVCMFIFSVRKQWAAVLFPILIWYIPLFVMNVVQTVLMSLGEMGQYVSLDFIRWIPFCNMQQYEPLNPDGVVVGMNILYMAIFIAGFVCIGHFTFKKADLK